MANLIRIVDSAEDAVALLRRRSVDRDEAIERVVRHIIDDVRTRGDQALLELGRRFDAPNLQSILVTEEEIDSASVPLAHREAIAVAAKRVRTFHELQLGALSRGFTQNEGARQWAVMDATADPTLGFPPGAVGQRLLPVGAAGIYVPGGGAPYASSVIMNAVPAQVAGVARVLVTSPAANDGSLAPAVLAAIRETGVREAYKVGGAGAIAALAFGTESIPRVDMIAGPGNRYVNEAKRQVWGSVGLDGYAGPSEVCVLADDDANPAWAAADLLTQIEHAPDNAAFLITLSRAKADEILSAVERQLKGAAREHTMRTALQTESLAIVVRDLHEAADVINTLAPEHVTVAVKGPELLLPRIRNAGCILLGEWTPESAGDFVLGPSHTLPTRGAARFGSAVNVFSFIRVQSVAHLTSDDLTPLVPTISAFGEMEGFPAHAHGATIRQNARFGE
jgi:histidinol dehydrogenase